MIFKSYSEKNRQSLRVADENIVGFQVAVYYVTPMHLLDNVKQLDAKEQDQPLGKQWLLQSVRIHKVLQKSTTKEILNSKVQYFKRFQSQVLIVKTLRKWQRHLQAEFHDDGIRSKSSSRHRKRKPSQCALQT